MWGRNAEFFFVTVDISIKFVMVHRSFILDILFDIHVTAGYLLCTCQWYTRYGLHVAKFYGRLRLIRSVWRASKLSVFKIDRNCNFVGLLHHPLWLQLILAPFGHYFSTF